jgi:hypothetical protein
VSAVLAVAIVALVGYLAVTARDVQRVDEMELSG